MRKATAGWVRAVYERIHAKKNRGDGALWDDHPQESAHLIGTWSLAQQMIETQDDDDHDALQENQHLHEGRRQPGEEQVGKRQRTQKEDNSGNNTHGTHSMYRKEESSNSDRRDADDLPDTRRSEESTKDGQGMVRKQGGSTATDHLTKRSRTHNEESTNNGQGTCEKVQINGCTETYTLTTHRMRSEAQRKQSATTGNKRATAGGGGVNATKTTAPRQAKITEYIDLRDGYAMQGEEWHTQQTKVNPPHTQPAPGHPQPNYTNSTPTQVTLIPTQSVPLPSHITPPSPHPIPTHPHLIPTRLLPNPIPSLRHPAPPPPHTNLIH